jgi:hypoxanthine-guanine phosphoribosyltransferase
MGYTYFKTTLCAHIDLDSITEFMAVDIYGKQY